MSKTFYQVCALRRCDGRHNDRQTRSCLLNRCDKIKTFRCGLMDDAVLKISLLCLVVLIDNYVILIDNLTWHILILSQHLIQLTG